MQQVLTAFTQLSQVEYNNRAILCIQFVGKCADFHEIFPHTVAGFP